MNIFILIAVIHFGLAVINDLFFDDYALVIKNTCAAIFWLCVALVFHFGVV